MNRKMAEELVFALWKANAQTHDDRIAIVISALEARYKAGQREAFVAGAKFTPLSGKPELWIDQVKAEALRRYPEEAK